MEAYKNQAVAKAKVRRNDFLYFKDSPNGPVICGIVNNVSGLRHASGAYTKIYITRPATGTGAWYKMEDLILCKDQDKEPESPIVHLCITYLMHKNHGTCIDPRMEYVETCATIAMHEDYAEDILVHGAESGYLSKLCGKVYIPLSYISELQGYYYSDFCAAELIRLDDKDRE